MSISNVGFVVIGRNEGKRLERCLTSIQTHYPACAVVYVDSGSEDGSVAFAQNIGIHVVGINDEAQFTAGLARNTGYQTLIASHSQLAYVQFLDGDCEIEQGWIEASLEAFKGDQEVGVCSGRRRERHPRATIFNELIDQEWDTPIGETRSVLGDMMVTSHVFQQVGGFKPDIIAAEDDDLCLRISAAGLKIMRIDQDMSIHDANITTLKQWYRRTLRGGHGYANIYHVHEGERKSHFRRHILSALFWGGAMPVGVIIGIIISPVAGLICLGLYILMIMKLAAHQIKLGSSWKLRLAYPALLLSSKVVELLGICRYAMNALLAKNHHLIEYK